MPAGDSGDKSGTPFAHARPTAAKPIDSERIRAIAKPFQSKSVAQMYLGPAWVTEDGTPCIVLIAHNPKWPKRVAQMRECALIAWRWNDVPSVPFSLTLMMRTGTDRPHVRWMSSDNDLVVQAIRRHGKFLMTVANTQGVNSGWFEAIFHDSASANTPPSKRALERLWTFSTAGIPYSSTTERFVPMSYDKFNTERDDEIPLWAEPVSDFWKIMDYEGPWANDLTPRDQAIAAWGYEAWHIRYTAAGFIQVLLEKQRIDGKLPFFDEDGQFMANSPVKERVDELVRLFPLLGRWLTALAGPHPDAKAAYDAAFAVFNDPPSLFAAVGDLFGLLSDIDDEALSVAIKTSFEAAIVDHRITGTGSLRPWLANTGTHSLELKTFPIDLTAPLEDIKRLWRSGLEMLDLLDAGRTLTESDFLVPLDKLCEDMEKVTVHGSFEEAEVRIHALLQEAKEARHWSIPWGARVEIQFGPFVALRIHELDGEFTCYFLDEAERYFPVAIGLQQNPPQISTRQLVRRTIDSAQPIWNFDAEVSLKLIAAAIVRDFLVVEERESLFSSRPFRRRIRGKDIKTVIYLPRVRYNQAHPERMPLDEDRTVRPRHSVAPHLRRANTASATQRFLAQRYGVRLPEGFTFVRPHDRGLAADEHRIRVYRSRSASRMIFDAIDAAPAGTRPAWFDFEKDCARLLISRGMKVVHQAAQRDGDGGVDLFAVDTNDQPWVVQCKCWSANRPVGPHVVRELEGAMRLVDKGSSTTSKGMIITTSTFTSGAVSTAIELGFELIDGAKMAKLLANQLQQTT